jgi:integrase
MPETSSYAAAPTRFLDQLEEQRMDISDEKLVAEAIEINHPGIGKDKTLDHYHDHLVHFSQYLASVHGKTFYSCRSKHVRLFMGHLARPGGPNPHSSRLGCEWCKARGYPDGRSGCGWSPSYRKSYLAAIKFLYRQRGYTPTRAEVKKLLEAPGSPRARLLVHWIFYAPSRRATFADARWSDIDLETGTWEVVGKGDKPDIFVLNAPLLRMFKIYRRWQLAEAERNSAMRDALSDPETAYVLLTRTGKRTSPEAVYKMLRWHAIRAGVGLYKTNGRWDAPGGITSRVSPHALRRAWATIALNDEELPTDVVSEVLMHREIATTRRHYAPTKPARAQAALLGMRMG